MALPSGLEMMLKAFGLNPEELMQQFEAFQKTIATGLQQMNTKLTEIQESNRRIETKLDAYYKGASPNPPEELSIYNSKAAQELIESFDPTNPTAIQKQE